MSEIIEVKKEVEIIEKFDGPFLTELQTLIEKHTKLNLHLPHNIKSIQIIIKAHEHPIILIEEFEFSK